MKLLMIMIKKNYINGYIKYKKLNLLLKNLIKNKLIK